MALEVRATDVALWLCHLAAVPTCMAWRLMRGLAPCGARSHPLAMTPSLCGLLVAPVGRKTATTYVCLPCSYSISIGMPASSVVALCSSVTVIAANGTCVAASS